MSRIIWDEVGKRTYETGVKMGVLYPAETSGIYGKGVAWNGLTSISESPSGAEANPIYADDIKYLNLMSAEEFGATIEAYTYPDEFAECDGTLELTDGVVAGQQKRKPFGLCYRTSIGNDVDGSDYGYKIHLIYGGQASPSDKAYSTINDSPEAISFSWELTTTPVVVHGCKPTASLTINSTKVDKDKLEILEGIIYGTDGVEPRLPMPDEVVNIFKSATPEPTTVIADPIDKATAVAVSKNIVLTFNNEIIEEHVMIVSAAGTIVDSVKTLDATKKILTINPKLNLTASTTYLVNVIGVVDRLNRTVPMSVLTFTTA